MFGLTIESPNHGDRSLITKPWDEAGTGNPATTLRVTRWHDPIVDERGYEPRSGYVERFWLGILGPSTTLLLRRFAAELGSAFALVRTGVTMLGDVADGAVAFDVPDLAAVAALIDDARS